jgi:hypothetical protein
MTDQPIAEASTYTGQHNIQTQKTNIHALSGILTRNPNNQAAGPCSHRDRQRKCFTKYIILKFPNYKQIEVKVNLHFIGGSVHLLSYNTHGLRAFFSVPHFS